MLKRKSVVEDDLPRLEDQVKRCRISQTPGELRWECSVQFCCPLLPLTLVLMYRLAKDLEELERMDRKDFRCERLQRNAVHITILSSREGCPLPQPRTSCSFIVEVSKFYPHDRPSVRCLEDSIQSHYVQPGGLVTHVDLMANWRATNSLTTVISALREIVHSNGSLTGKDNTMNIDWMETWCNYYCIHVNIDTFINIHTTSCHTIPYHVILGYWVQFHNLLCNLEDLKWLINENDDECCCLVMVMHADVVVTFACFLCKINGNGHGGRKHRSFSLIFCMKREWK